MHKTLKILLYNVFPTERANFQKSPQINLVNSEIQNKHIKSAKMLKNVEKVLKTVQFMNFFFIFKRSLHNIMTSGGHYTCVKTSLHTMCFKFRQITAVK